VIFCWFFPCVPGLVPLTLPSSWVHCTLKLLHDLTIRWPSISNFSGQSRILRACPEKNTRSFGTLNSELYRLPNLSRFNVKMCCSSNSWSKCNWSFWCFCLSETRWCVLLIVLMFLPVRDALMCSVELKMHQIHFRLEPRTPLREFMTLPRPPSRMRRGIPLPHTSHRSRRLCCLEKCPGFLSQIYGHLTWLEHHAAMTTISTTTTTIEQHQPMATIYISIKLSIGQWINVNIHRDCD